YRQNGHVCIDLAVLDDSPASAASLLQAGKAWAVHLPSASVTQSGATVDFLSCDPGAGWRPAAHIANPYDALAARSILMYDLLTDAHLGATTATCAASQILATIGPSELPKVLQSDDPTASELQALRSATTQAVAGCG